MEVCTCDAQHCRKRLATSRHAALCCMPTQAHHLVQSRGCQWHSAAMQSYAVLPSCRATQLQRYPAAALPSRPCSVHPEGAWGRALSLATPNTAIYLTAWAPSLGTLPGHSAWAPCLGTRPLPAHLKVKAPVPSAWCRSKAATSSLASSTSWGSGLKASCRKGHGERRRRERISKTVPWHPPCHAGLG